MSGGYDAAVIGGGPNGLTAATLLARAGRRVLLVERRALLGGLAASEEFCPGFHGAGLFHDSTRVSPAVVEELALERHGLRRGAVRPDLVALGAGGSAFLLAGDAAQAAEEIAVFSARDAERYAAFRSYLAGIRSLVLRWLDEPPLDLFDDSFEGKWRLLRFGLRLRRLGRQGMLELLRLPPMPVADWLDEWFETDALKGALALPAVVDTFAGPRSPGTTANLLLFEAAAGGAVEGGGAALVAALERAAREAGVEIRTGREVERLLFGATAVEGLLLDGGERIAARAVLGSGDPKQLFLRLVPQERLSARLERDVGAFRARGSLAHLLLAVRGPIELACRPGRPFEHARTAYGMDAIERAFDAVKHGRVPHPALLDLWVPTVKAPALAPAGHHVLSVRLFAPEARENGEAQREALTESALAEIERHVSGLASRIVGRRLLLPRDLAERYGASGGHPCHGEHALDQLLVRPAPGCTHATPIPGLYLCGSGSHPGGGLTCRPGALGARALVGASRA